jgi:uncharacterized protein YecT (DUF1311 family)
MIRLVSALLLACLALHPAAAARAKTPLESCYEAVGSQGRTAVAPCLAEMLAEAEKEMGSVLTARRQQALDLAKATGRRQSERSLGAAQKRFVAYRDAQCAYVHDAMDAGTGAGDAQRDCLVRLTRQRIEELRTNP